jgi:hypothetical protein
VYKFPQGPWYRYPFCTPPWVACCLLHLFKPLSHQAISDSLRLQVDTLLLPAEDQHAVNGISSLTISAAKECPLHLHPCPSPPALALSKSRGRGSSSSYPASTACRALQLNKKECCAGADLALHRFLDSILTAKMLFRGATGSRSRAPRAKRGSLPEFDALNNNHCINPPKTSRCSAEKSFAKPAMSR